MKRKSSSKLMALARNLVLAVALSGFLAGDALARSLQEAAERVARQYDAEVVSAREIERNGQRVYVIRILTKDGVVRTIRVPARGR